MLSKKNPLYDLRSYSGILPDFRQASKRTWIYGRVPVGNGHAAAGLNTVFTATGAAAGLAAGLAAAFLATGFLAAGLAAAFLATGFLAAGLAAAFLATGFLAAGLAAAFLATGFLAAAFLTGAVSGTNGTGAGASTRSSADFPGATSVVLT